MDLRTTREAAQITQGQLAQRTGILQTNISLQENGGRSLAVDEMVLCERALQSPIDWPDRFNANDKADVFRAMITLAERFPIASVLAFTQKVLGDRLDNAPVQKLLFVASQTTEVEPMLPTDVQIEIKAKEKK
jgi:transcriptional regulator with XRE-family HTH domain